jgi:hypothetical protein
MHIIKMRKEALQVQAPYLDPLCRNPSSLTRWVIALTPGDKWNRQLNVGLAVSTCSTQILSVSGVVITCLSYKCIHR